MTTEFDTWEREMPLVCDGKNCLWHAEYAVRVHVINNCCDDRCTVLDLYGNKVYFLCHSCAVISRQWMARIVQTLISQVSADEYPACATCHGVIRSIDDTFRMEPISVTAR